LGSGFPESRSLLATRAHMVKAKLQKNQLRVEQLKPRDLSCDAYGAIDTYATVPEVTPEETKEEEKAGPSPSEKPAARDSSLADSFEAEPTPLDGVAQLGRQLSRFFGIPTDDMEESRAGQEGVQPQLGPMESFSQLFGIGGVASDAPGPFSDTVAIDDVGQPASGASPVRPATRSGPIPRPGAQPPPLTRSVTFM